MKINTDKGYWFEKLEENNTSGKVEDRGEGNKSLFKKMQYLLMPVYEL